MILVTVGAQMPFDRLVRTVDDWAGRAGRSDVFAQIGHTRWRPRHLQWTAFIEPDEFRARAREAAVLVAHAGTGSILTALELGRPILVMPRRADLRETRNDHQIATATRFRDMAATSRSDWHSMARVGRRVRERGLAEMMIVTRGAMGALAILPPNDPNGGAWRLQSPKGKVVSMVGAGDSLIGAAILAQPQ